MIFLKVVGATASAIVLSAFPMLVGATYAAPGDSWNLSVPSAKLASPSSTITPSLNNLQRERVMEFRVTIADGSIVALPHIPPGWKLEITNDLALHETTIVGRALGGVAAVDLDFFEGFIVVLEGAGNRGDVGCARCAAG